MFAYPAVLGLACAGAAIGAFGVFAPAWSEASSEASSEALSEAGLAASIADCAQAPDLLARKACLSQSLDTARSALDAAVDDLLAASTGAPRVRGRTESAMASWRTLRGHDCALQAEAAALGPDGEGLDTGLFQLECALTKTLDRRDEIAALAATFAAQSTTDVSTPDQTLGRTPDPRLDAAPGGGPAAAQAVIIDPDTAKNFGSWTAGCGPRRCVAFTSAQRARANGRVIDMARLEYARPRDQSAPDAPSTDTVGALNMVALEPGADPDAALIFTVDRAEPVSFAGRREHAAVAQPNAFRLVSVEKAQTLAQTMRAGLQLSVSYTAADRSVAEATFDLRGATAAFAWVDAQTAALARGPGTPNP